MAHLPPLLKAFRLGSNSQSPRTASVRKLTRSENMARIRSRDTKPELIVRSLTHGMGFRFRLHRRDLPGSPDLVFPGRKKIVLVHGCFWHQHDCPRGHKQPSTRREYWVPKLARNVERDSAVQAELRARGWDVLVVWECETRETDKLSRQIRKFLD